MKSQKKRKYQKHLEERKMSKLTELLGKTKKFVVAGKEWEIKPLTVENLDLLTRLRKDEEREKSIPEFIYLGLNGADNEITMEEVKQIPFDIALEFLNAILEANGLSDKATSKKLAEPQH